MEKALKEMLREFVNSQHFIILSAIKKAKRLAESIWLCRKNIFDCLQDTGLLDLGFVI